MEVIFYCGLALGIYKLRSKIGSIANIGVSGPLSAKTAKAYNTQLGASFAKNDVPGVILGTDKYGPYDKSLFVIGLPGSGKTSWTVRNILHLPGPAIVTSTKRELFALTAGSLVKKGRPVWVFDCANQIPSLGALRLRWSPLQGCEDPQVARKVAGRFAYAAGFTGASTNADFWTTQTTNCLQWLFVAASLAAENLASVLEWISDFDELQRAAALLRQHGYSQGSKFLLDTFSRESLSSGPSSSIVSGVNAALAGFASASLVEACSPAQDDPQFSVDTWLSQKGVVYLIGTVEDQKSVAGVIAAFIEDTLERARSVSTPIRPPVRLVLDEAPNIAVLRTLPEIITTGRGDGIAADIIGQDLHKFEESYGRSQARTIRLSCAGELVFGGSRDVDHLRELSQLTGEQTSQSRSVSVGGSQKTTTTAERIEARLKMEDIRLLKPNHALLLYANLTHSIVHLKPYWQVPGDYLEVAISRLWCEKRFFSISDFPLPKDLVTQAERELKKSTDLALQEGCDEQSKAQSQVNNLGNTPGQGGDEEFTATNNSQIMLDTTTMGNTDTQDVDMMVEEAAKILAERRSISFQEALEIIEKQIKVLDK
jgi:hypothetical protein